MAFGPHWLPVAVFILLPSTFIITFVIAVLLNHVEADFPYISDTGTNSPESCIFGQLLNISAVLIGATVYVRYRQVQEYISDEVHLARANKASLVLGMLSALGISMVGNFQETNVLVVHLTGALMAFGLGTVYAWIHTAMAYNMVPHINTKLVCHIRVVICAICTITFIMTFTFDGIAKRHYHGKNPRKWYPEDGGFTEHIISSASEWTMAISLLFFFLTFVHEFKNIHVTAPQISLLLMRSEFEGSSPLYIGADDVIT